MYLLFTCWYVPLYNFVIAWLCKLGRSNSMDHGNLKYHSLTKVWSVKCAVFTRSYFDTPPSNKLSFLKLADNCVCKFIILIQKCVVFYINLRDLGKCMQYCSQLSHLSLWFLWGILHQDNLSRTVLNSVMLLCWYSDMSVSVTCYFPAIIHIHMP